MISMISVILNQIFRIFFDGVVRLKKAWIPSFTPQLLGHQLKYILAAAQVFTTAALIFSTDTVFQTNIPLLQLLGKTTFLILSCLIAYLIINKSKIKEKFRLSFLLLIAIINYHSLHFLTVITKTTDIINEFSFQIQTYTMQEPTLYYYQFIKPFNESELNKL